MDSARHVIKRILNPRFLSLASSYDVASSIHQSLYIGDYAAGVSTLMRALAATETAVGRHSPAVANVLVALGDAHAGAGGRSDLAVPLLERALGISEQTLGPEVGRCRLTTS